MGETNPKGINKSINKSEMWMLVKHKFVNAEFLEILTLLWFLGKYF